MTDEIGALKTEVNDLRAKFFSAQDAAHRAQLGLREGITAIRRLLAWAEDGATPPPPDVASELDQMVRVLPDGD